MPIINKTNTTRGSVITFYVLHLPVLMLIFGVIALYSVVSSKLVAKTFSKPSTEQPLGYVLGNDSDGDDDDNKDEDDDKDDDDNDDDDKDDNDDDKDEDDDKDDDEDADEDEEEFEQEDEDENDEDASENRTKTQQRVQNSDGTYSVTKTETEGDKLKIETKTYDASGKLLNEEKHEGSDEGFESETEDSIGNKFKIRVQDKETLIKREGVTGLNNFPLYIDENDGSVYVQTPTGEVKLGIMPQSIVEKAISLDNVDSIVDVELESESESADKLEFKLRTKESKRLFGIFELEIPTTVYFDAQNGDQTRSEQTFINKVLDFLSF